MLKMKTVAFNIELWPFEVVKHIGGHFETRSLNFLFYMCHTTHTSHSNGGLKLANLLNLFTVINCTY